MGYRKRRGTGFLFSCRDEGQNPFRMSRVRLEGIGSAPDSVLLCYDLRLGGRYIRWMRHQWISGLIHINEISTLLEF